MRLPSRQPKEAPWPTPPRTPNRPVATGAYGACADGTVVWGIGIGAEGSAVGEVCFNTAMTGYQEAMTDPSYAGQIITFTTPHIGNTGANPEDVEATNPHALGCIVAAVPSEAASWRATGTFDNWLKSWGRIGLAGVDTRAITRRIRDAGAPNAVIAHSPTGEFDVPALLRAGAAWPGLEGMDLAKGVSTTQSYGWDDGLWTLGQGYATHAANPDGPQVVAVDYGMKRNILRNLVAAGARVTVVPATATFDEIMAHEPARHLPVERPRRSGGDRRVCRADDPGGAQRRHAAVRHLPRPPAPRPRGRARAPTRCTRATAARTTRSSG